MGQRITDKKLRDRRFRKTEKAIIKVFFGSKRVLSARLIVKRAKISRATLYRHHGPVYEIVPDYEKYILKTYNGLIQGLVRRRGIRVKVLYHQILIFMMKNRDIFKMIVEKGSGRLLERMIRKIEPKIIEFYRLPKNCERMLMVYEKEITGMLEDWVRNDFKESESVILSDMMYLTETMRGRLMQLIR